MTLTRRKTLALIGGGVVLAAAATTMTLTKAPETALAPWAAAGSWAPPGCLPAKTTLPQRRSPALPRRCRHRKKSAARIAPRRSCAGFAGSAFGYPTDSEVR